MIGKRLALFALLVLILNACTLPGMQPTPTTAPPTNTVAAPTDTMAPPTPTASDTAAPPEPTASPSETASPKPTETEAIPIEPIRPLDPFTKITLYRFDMLDRLNGWATGGEQGTGIAGHVFRTIDGGTEWLDVSPAELSPVRGAGPIAVGTFANANYGWVTFYQPDSNQIPANPVVWFTADAGLTWASSLNLDTSGFERYYRVVQFAFSGTKYGWLLVQTGGSELSDRVAFFRSSDSGKSWQRTISPSEESDLQKCHVTGMLLLDSVRGWLTGDCKGTRITPLLFRTTDGGSTWMEEILPPPPDRPGLFEDTTRWCEAVSPIRARSSVALIVACHSLRATPEPDAYYMYYSGDQGSTWTVRDFPGGRQLMLLSDISSGGLAFGRDIYLTLDSGGSWSKVGTVPWDGVFDFINSKEGWALGWIENIPHFFQTVDGAKSWVEINPYVVKK